MLPNLPPKCPTWAPEVRIFLSEHISEAHYPNYTKCGQKQMRSSHFNEMLTTIDERRQIVKAHLRIRLM